MDFFATGAFQQLYNELDEPTEMQSQLNQLLSDNSEYDYLGMQASSYYQPPPTSVALDCCYADVSLIDNYDPGGSSRTNNSSTANSSSSGSDADIYDLTMLDSNNNLDNQLEEFQFDLQEVTRATAPALDYLAESSSLQEFSDWEQSLLENFVEIPELIDFLPERTPLCTDMCDDFLQESNDNLRLSRPASHTPPPTLPPPTAASAGSGAQETSEQPLLPLLTQNAAGERGYMCTFPNCEKLYAKPAHLKAHLRRHLGEKPYVCSWPSCSWRFSRSDELARHRRSHSGVKPYKCNYCAKCFARSDHLTKHRKVHERRLLAASRAGNLLPNGPLPQSVYTVRPGRKRKNQL